MLTEQEITTEDLLTALYSCFLQQLLYKALNIKQLLLFQAVKQSILQKLKLLRKQSDCIDSCNTLIIQNLLLLQLKRTTEKPQHQLAKNPEFYTRIKYINIQYYFMQQKVKEDLIKLKQISTADNIADRMTKPLRQAVFDKFRSKIRMQVISDC